VRLVRRTLRFAGAPGRVLLVGAIHAYRRGFSGAWGGRCRFYPSCSAYALEAVRSRGAVVGSILAVSRLLRCNPFGGSGLDPVPRPQYDGITQKGTG
jgi:putative membrane protein insertion efficiency factor